MARALADLASLTPPDSVRPAISADDFLREGGASIVLGGHHVFDRSQWPIPEFERQALPRWTVIRLDTRANETSHPLPDDERGQRTKHSISLGSPAVVIWKALGYECYGD